MATTTPRASSRPSTGPPRYRQRGQSSVSLEWPNHPAAPAPPGFKYGDYAEPPTGAGHPREQQPQQQNSAKVLRALRQQLEAEAIEAELAERTEAALEAASTHTPEPVTEQEDQEEEKGVPHKSPSEIPQKTSSSNPPPNLECPPRQRPENMYLWSWERPPSPYDKVDKRWSLENRVLPEVRRLPATQAIRAPSVTFPQPIPAARHSYPQPVQRRRTSAIPTVPSHLLAAPKPEKLLHTPLHEQPPAEGRGSAPSSRGSSRGRRQRYGRRFQSKFSDDRRRERMQSRGGFSRDWPMQPVPQPRNPYLPPCTNELLHWPNHPQEATASHHCYHQAGY
eukprot:TRINITY_DN160_c0_g1_i10.p1 TRINITY_DN160_c0_g1~~TRINITY_DN160_c0_g1_i10.p1  ORF type:complete len:336 (-),score=47.58 TRINITY_DN160_c0_g1_i10:523-1530(-)